MGGYEARDLQHNSRHCDRCTNASLNKFSSKGVKHLWIIPLFGNTFTVFIGWEHFLKVLERLCKKFPRERYVGKYIFTEPVIVLQDLTLITKVTQKHFDNFHDHPFSKHPTDDALLCTNLQFLTGNDWKDMRSTFSPMFTTSRIKDMIPFMAVVAEEMKSVLLEMINGSSTGSIEVNVNDFTNRLANEVFADCVFGIKSNSLRNQNNEFYKMGMEMIANNYSQIFSAYILGHFPSLDKVSNIFGMILC
ncbi:unnamed protein product [Euphydryas editha]|uniref:unspecific monooxygenase n=1 Tax=Euphydryas editha TaxID=104508 RepID=A0AAU9V6Z9_EUPED|nr:unnamed protein product [Euphydryas editha]